MNWYIVKIFLLISCAAVLCASEEKSSEEDTKEPPKEFSPFHIDLDRKHHHKWPPHKVPKPPPPRPPLVKPPQGPVPLPKPPPKTCPRYEEYHDCGSPCQVECANLGKKCNIQNVRCSDGCYCIPGYARISPGGPCVPQYKCPKAYCPNNEVWLDCYQAPACDRECARLGKPCETIGSSCSAGCFCRSGYARHPQTGDCVPFNKCPPSAPECPQYEELQQCDYRCKEDCDTTLCTRVKFPCEKGCFCQPGFARVNGTCVLRPACLRCLAYERKLDCGNDCIEACNKDGLDCTKCERSGCFCIEGYARIDGYCKPESKCPDRCPKNEVYSDCGKKCDENCDTSLPCSQVCTKGCFCREGYARINGVCKPRNKCPAQQPQCSRYEQFKQCELRCKEDCDATLCSRVRQICEKGCFCQPGYARVNGVCQPRYKCQAPPTQPPQCPKHEIFQECEFRCKEDCDTTLCTRVKFPCETGCFCEPGYARVNGVCQPRYKCTKNQCNINEVFLECGNACQDSCLTQFCPAQCIPGCYCQEGYAKINDVCVPRSQCPGQCSENEVYLDCGTACQDDCNENKTCSTQCVTGCFCEEGYARIDGKCVDRYTCPVYCPVHEHYEDCGNVCIESCNKELLDCSPDCYEGCYCDKGFARIDGRCVPEKYCKKCGFNEKFLKCGNGCQDLCDASAAQCSSECVTGCFCQDGFSRIKGVCVPRSTCFNCGSGEEYTVCSNSCLERCDRNALLCPDTCEEGCFCSDGFSRINGQCVPNELCPECGENEEYQDCGDSCLELCSHPPCPTDPVCNAGCYCIEGFKRTADGCVPEDECPPSPPVCENPNEVYSDCGNNCTDLCPEPSRVCTADCYSGCFCADGYSRPDYDSPCIPTEECPPPIECPGKHEQYYDCGNSCMNDCPDPNKNCDLICEQGCFCEPDYVRLRPDGPCVPEWKCPNLCTNPFEVFNRCGNNCTELCPRPGRACEKNCWQGCFCKKGYHRERYNGVCIPEKQCPPPPVCTGPNEEILDCGNACDDNCPGGNYNCPIDCQVGCYCKPGFKRVDPGGDCVSESECSVQCTDSKEVFLECGNHCREECNSGVCTDICERGCFCKPGFSRLDGKCIPTKKCPTQCPGPNEVYAKCGNTCREQCGSTRCPAVCQTGCFCAEGFKRVTPDSPCTPDSQCPTQCSDPNEEYTTCGSQCKEKCGKKLCPALCEVGCFCKDGYSRINGACVPTSQCFPQCSGQNEVYAKCGNTCRDQCGSTRCPAVCQTGCFCAEGFKRATPDSPCIPDSECPTQCTDPNEEYTTCGNYCTEKCGKKFCPALCQVGCFCKEGYSRKNGVCIPTSQCSPQCSGENEVYAKCGNTCRDQCGSTRCPAVCQTGCFCAEGFKRATPDSPCIPDSECPTQCSDPNEEYTTCGSKCNEKCGKKFCPALCEVGCFCKEGYSRVNGACVPTTQCFPQCSGQNEVYAKCGNTCRDQCGSTRCPAVCQTGCFCAEGFKRATPDSPCIPASECSSPTTCSGPNEIYTTCGNSCQERCGTYFCPALCETGCFCKPGYFRVQGLCVPPKKCPKCGENEEYNYCASGCTDPCDLRNAQCKDVCQERCSCKPDYSRISDGTPCVPDSECPADPGQTCGKNEVYTDCGRDCQTQCDTLGVRCTIEHIICPSGCYCEPGYARIYEGGCCVEQDICPVSPCGDNEVWLECGDPPQPIPCPQSCDEISTVCTSALPSCDTPAEGGCYCKQGYAREPDSELCIPHDQCSSNAQKK